MSPPSKLPTSQTGARTALVALLALGLAGCAAPAEPVAAQGDPRNGEVPLPAAPGWEARLILDVAPTGVWAVRAFPIFPQYAVPEIVGLDDAGRAWVCVSYSGKWTPLETVHDGKWLGCAAHGDVDPRIAGDEMYIGGQAGNLYQVVAYREGVLDHRRIAHIAGREIHTILARGEELLAFTRPGGLYCLTPTGPDGQFETSHLLDLPGRVRDALDLGGEDGFVTASRTGRLEHWRASDGGYEPVTIHTEEAGLGRLARKPPAYDGELVFYAGLDDGRVLRVERTDHGSWATSTIHSGAQGLRGLAAGNFDSDPRRECVAVFGYSGTVEILTHEPNGWVAREVFHDRDKGHWLEAAELDGRNGTLELIASGYGGRIVLLARRPGFGL